MQSGPTAGLPSRKGHGGTVPGLGRGLEILCEAVQIAADPPNKRINGRGEFRRPAIRQMQFGDLIPTNKRRQGHESPRF